MSHFETLRADHPAVWEALQEIQSVFAARGHTIVLVGGAVRNLVLGLPLNDYDLATDAKPEEVQKMFRHVIPTGIKHGTVTLVHRKQHFEITTFRLDGAYSDARRPDSVSFTADITEDLRRRDFTINAMALDLGSLELIDPHGGRADLEQRIIRTVGDPQERFDEDGLRIMRGLRFAAQLGFGIHRDTWLAMPSRLDRLAKVSAERFRDELLKTLAAPVPSTGLFPLRESGALGLFLPEVAGLSDADYARACLQADLAPRGEPEPRLAALVEPLPPAARTACLDRLRLSNQQRKLSLLLAAAAEGPVSREAPALRRWAAASGRAQLSSAVNLAAVAAIARSAGPVPTAVMAGSDSAVMLSCRPAWFDALVELVRAADDHAGQLEAALAAALVPGTALKVGELAIDGKRLQEAGLPAGPALGEALDYLLSTVIENPIENVSERLVELAVAWKRSRAGD